MSYNCLHFHFLSQFRFTNRAVQIDLLITAYKKNKVDQRENLHKIAAAKETEVGDIVGLKKVLEQCRNGMSLLGFGIEASNIRIMGIDLSPRLISDVVRGDQLLCYQITKCVVDPVFTGAEFAKDLTYKPPAICEHRIDVLVTILAALGWRRTTAGKDEPVCIGSMIV